MRILYTNPAAYSEFNILSILSGDILEPFRPEIAAIVYRLKRVIAGQNGEFDFTWLETILNNEGIKAFFANYSTSIFDLIERRTGPTVFIASQGEAIPLVLEDTRVILELGQSDYSLILSSTESQTVGFTLDANTVFSEDTAENSFIEAHVSVHPQIKTFFLDCRCKITDDVRYQIDTLKCSSGISSISNDFEISTPAPFYTCDLTVASYDRGVTWYVTNLEIVPPQM